MMRPPAPPPERAPDLPTPPDLADDHIGAALMAVAVSCFLHLITLIGRAAVPGWPPTPLLPLVFALLFLLSFYRHRWLRLYRPFGGHWSIYLAELTLLVLLTRLVPLLTTPEQLLALTPRWLADPGSLLDAQFVIGLLLVLPAWLLGHHCGALVDLLHLQTGEAPPPRGSLAFSQWERLQSPFDHRIAYQRLVNLAIGGGLVTVLLIGALATAVRASSVIGEGLATAGLYALASLLGLGWAHLLLLDTLWRVDGLAMPPLLRQRWAGWLAAIIALVAVVALLAPRSYAVDPVALLILMMQLVVALFQLIIFLIMLPLIWLASLLGLGNTSGAVGAPPALPPVIPREEQELPWLALLRSLGFWLLTAGLVIYSLRTLYQSRWGIGRWLPRLPLLAWLGRLWQGFFTGLRRAGASLLASLRPAVARQLMATLRRTDRPARPVDARGWVLFLYLSLIERAGRRGLPRRRGMTAAEYSHYLAVRLLPATAPAGPEPPPSPAGLLPTTTPTPPPTTDHPLAGPAAAEASSATATPPPADTAGAPPLPGTPIAAAPVPGPAIPRPAAVNQPGHDAGQADAAAARADLDALTAAFLEARYSRHAVGDSTVGTARRALQRLLTAIRHLAAGR